MSLDGYGHVSFAESFAESMRWIATQSYIARWGHYMDGIKGRYMELSFPDETDKLAVVCNYQNKSRIRSWNENKF